MRNIFFLICAMFIACNSGTSTEVGDLDRWWTDDDRQFILSELKRTTDELRVEIEQLGDDQWNFREDTTRWSIAEIVEHLEMQNQLHYREVTVISQSPQHLSLRTITEGMDTFFSGYRTDTTKSKAKWFLEPLGRYCSMETGQAAFFKARGELTLFVEQTQVDLRKQFTFRAPIQAMGFKNIKIGQVRDLHQLLLTGIAHTDRHLAQIRTIKRHENYPK